MTGGGGEFQVNTHFLNDQRFPAVTGLADGGFIIVYDSDHPDDGSGLGIFAQRYAADGRPVGNEFRVNSETTDHQSIGEVAELANGDIVITWNSNLQDGSDYGIFGQRFDAGGAPKGPEFQVNTFTTGDQNFLAPITALQNGGFVIAWSSEAQDGDNYGVFAQRYDASGNPAGPEFQVNTYTASIQWDPQIATLSNGDFVITWASWGNDGTGMGVFAQRYDATGATVGGEFQVNTTTLFGQFLPDIAPLNNGGYVITWQSQQQDGSGLGIYGQRFDNTDTAVGLEFPVNTFTTNDQARPDVAVQSDGSFVIVWASFGQDGNQEGGFGQRFAADGTPLGAEFQINTYTDSEQDRFDVSGLVDGGFVVSWDSYGQDGSGVGVFAQRYDKNGNPLPAATLGTDEDDTIDLSGPGGGTAAGGLGDDTYIVDDPNDVVVELGGQGTDTIEASISFTAPANVENVTLTGDQALDATGNELENVLVGNTSNNELSGEDGDDELDAGFGNDVLDGGKGADLLKGGNGNDLYFVDNPGDRVIESQSATIGLALAGPTQRFDSTDGGQVDPNDISDNIDEVVATVSYTLTDFVENLTLAGVDAIDGGGNELDNTITGNAAANMLSTGAGGVDTLSGGEGSDTFVIETNDSRVLIEDTPGDEDTLDLTAFNDGDLEIRDSAGGSLRIENGSGGVVELLGFYGSAEKSVHYIDFGAGPTDVSAVNSAADVAALSAGPAKGTLVDDDDNYWDAAIATTDGELITAEQAQVYRTYLGGLGREPDQSGYDWWLGQVEEGNHSLSSMADGFVNSAEFQDTVDMDGNGVVSSAEFVNHMYENVFGRAPDDDGFNYWTGELDAGNKTQGGALAEMTNSNEFVLQTVDATVDFLFG